MRISSITRTIAKKKVFFLALLCIVAAGFVFPQSAAACDLWEIGCGFNKLLLLVLQGFALVLSYVAVITDWAIQPSPITTSYFVQQGWTATRDFANMFFILILLAISLDFILFNSFGVKRALPKLLLIALLINFSIPIAGILLDFANIVTRFFLSQISQGTFTENVAQSVGISKSFDAETFTTVGGSLNEDTTGDNTFINTLFAIGLMIGMIFIFLALALMFLIRTGYISVLLIVLPMALVLSAFPPTSRHFGKWMSKFTQWVMFAPVAAFFLYLSMLLFTATSSKGILSMGGGTTVTEDSVAFTLLRYIMAWGLMLGSLVVAQSMGITTAGAALATWKSGTKWARGKASQAGKTMAAAGGRRMKAEERMEKLAGNIQRAVPGLGGILSSGIRGVASKTKAAMEKQEALAPAEKAKLEGLSDDALKQEMEFYEKSILPGSATKTAQIYEMLMKRGKHIERNEDGSPNVAATNERAIKMYATAKARGNKDMMRSIRKANPGAWQTIAEAEWKDAKTKGNIVTIVKDGIEVEQNKITGKTLEDTKNRAFEEMTSADFENLKGTWDFGTVKQFLESGSMSQKPFAHGKQRGDGHFVSSWERRLKTKNNGTSGEKIKNISNYLKSGEHTTTMVSAPLRKKPRDKGQEGGGANKAKEGKV